MKKHILIILSFLLLTITANAYGPIAHRAITLIAYEELSSKAKKNLDALLGKQGIVYASTWADEIRSEPDKYAYSYPWHYQNLATNMTENDLKTLWNNPRSEGDHLFYACQEMVKRLKNDRKDIEALKFLVHFTGDLHQPMHLGRKEDLGGNQVPYTWFGEKTNIHSLWDSYLVENKKMSYTELAAYLTSKLSSKREMYYQMTIPQVLVKSYSITNRIYEYSRTDTNNYRYVYQFNEDLDEMLYCAGVQLAKVLEEIY